MYKRFKNKIKTQNTDVLHTQDLYTQKSDREDFRINPKLKELIRKECEIKNISKTDFYTRLATFYFYKIGKVQDYKKPKSLVHGVDWEL